MSFIYLSLNDSILYIGCINSINNLSLNISFLILLKYILLFLINLI